MNVFWNILAQAPAGGPPGGTPAAPSAGPSMILFAGMMALVVFMMLSARSREKRTKRAHEEMIASLGKSDRVLTIGGVIGTVLSVKGDEVVLKVDESTNTKMTFTKSAIQKVVKDSE